MLIWTEETSPIIRKLLTSIQIVKLESEMENSKDVNILTIFDFLSDFDFYCVFGLLGDFLIPENRLFFENFKGKIDFGEKIFRGLRPRLKTPPP